MRKINQVIIHCSASKEGVPYTMADIRRLHTAPTSAGGRGWSDIGYHFVIHLDGEVAPGRPIERVGAHALGFNANSIGICYIGGLDEKGKAKDTRTAAQKISLRLLLEHLCKEYPIKSIIGHRDTSPDINGNGIIEPWEWLKQCPCFDAAKEYGYLCKG